MTAKARLTAVRRILSVQQQVRRLAEWKVATVHREAAALEAAHEALTAFLDGEAGISPLFAAAAMKQLQAIGAAKDRLEERRAIEEARLRAEAQRAGLAERLAQRAATDAAREAERDALVEVIERIVHRGGTSLP